MKTLILKDGEWKLVQGVVTQTELFYRQRAAMIRCKDESGHMHTEAIEDDKMADMFKALGELIDAKLSI